MRKMIVLRIVGSVVMLGLCAFGFMNASIGWNIGYSLDDPQVFNYFVIAMLGLIASRVLIGNDSDFD